MKKTPLKTLMRVFIQAICLLLFIPYFLSASESSIINASEAKTLVNEINAIAKAHNLVGLQLSINHKDGVLLEQNIGFASIEDSQDVNSNTLFRADHRGHCSYATGRAR